jgi:hypothetical protein
MVSRTWAALSSKLLRSLSKILSQPSNASVKLNALAASKTVALPLLIACNDATKVARKGWNILTNKVLSAVRRSST